MAVLRTQQILSGKKKKYKTRKIMKTTFYNSTTKGTQQVGIYIFLKIL